jgi:hypothetical protein
MKNLIEKVRDYFDSIWWYNHPIYLTYETIRYNIPQFIRNMWYFRKPLYGFRWWDPHFTYEMLRYSLMNMADNLETKGIEVDYSRMKKVTMIRRCVEILTHFKNDDFVDLAEAELGELPKSNFEFKKIEDSDYYELLDLSPDEDQEKTTKIFERAREIEEEYWAELWSILKGDQDYKTFDPNIDFYDQFNGTGMRGWWD